ncbi:MAG TPA: hypothetical protein VK666_11655 [Chryseolinea sp.]|nr:hypothetical protein [Chryseolinea sp.]
METKRDSTQKMLTLSEALNTAVKQGYTVDFKFTSGSLTTPERHHYKATDISISNFFRFEGYSDPQDNAILYLIETSDGKKGTLIDAYGAYSDATLATFIKTVEDIHKK